MFKKIILKRNIGNDEKIIIIDNNKKIIYIIINIG